MRSGPASSATNKTECCGCFQRKKRDSIALSDIYCRKCSTTGNCAQRSPLGPPENQCTCTSSSSNHKIANLLLNQSDYEIGKEKYRSKPKKKIKEKHNNTEFEFADDAISLNNDNLEERPPSRTSLQSNKETSFTDNPYINVNGKEELPCVQEINNKYCISNHIMVPNRNNEKTENDKVIIINNDNNVKNKINTNFDGNYNKLLSVSKIYSYCTLPKRKNTNNHKIKPINPPKRVTPDGTHIYYWCDLPKKINSGKIYLKKKCSVSSITKIIRHNSCN